MDEQEALTLLTSGKRSLPLLSAMQIYDLLGVPRSDRGVLKWASRKDALKRYCVEPERDEPGEGVFRPEMIRYLEEISGVNQVEPETNILDEIPDPKNKRIAYFALAGHTSPSSYTPREALELLRQVGSSYDPDEAKFLCAALAVPTSHSVRISGVDLSSPGPTLTSAYVDRLELIRHMANHFQVSDSKILAFWPRRRTQAMLDAIERRLYGLLL